MHPLESESDPARVQELFVQQREDYPAPTLQLAYMCLSVDAPLSHLDRCADSNMVTFLLNPPRRGQVHRVRVLAPPGANHPRHGLIACRARDRLRMRDV